MLKNKSLFTEELESLCSNVLINTPTPVLVTDPDHSIRYVNSSLKKITGYSSSEIIGRKPAYPWWPKEQRDKIMRIFQKDIKSGGNKREHYFQKKNGEYFWVEIKGTSIRKGQKIQYYISNWIDITQRKKTDEMLEGERFKLKEYFENLPLLAYNIGLDGKIVDCNKKVLETLGYKSKKELIGKPLITTIYAPSSKEKAKQLFTKWKKTRKLKDEELQVISKKGEIIDVSLNVDTVYDKEGRPLYSISTQQNIKERKQAEDKLSETSTFLNSILSNMQEYVAVADEHYTLQFVNEGYRKTFNANVGDKCYKVIRGFENPCHHFGIPCEIQEILKKKKDYFEDTRSASLGNKIIQIRAVPLTILNGKLAVISVFRDVTEETHGKEKLEKSYSLLHAAIESTADGILVVDQNKKITNYNEKWLKMFKPSDSILKSRDDEELMKYLLPKFKNPKEFKKNTNELLNNLDLEKFDEFEFKDGRAFERYSRPQRIAGKTVGRVISFRDITERKQAEYQLKESEERFRNIAERSIDIIYTIDLKGRLTYISPTIEKTLGYKPEEIIHKPLIKFLPKSEIPKVTVAFAKYLKGKDKPVLFETKVKGKDGSLVPIEVNASPIIKNHKINGFQGIVRDITERKQSEQALRESEEFSSSLLSNSTYPLFVANQDTSIKYVNPALETLTGFKSTEVLGKKVPYPWWPKERREELTKMLLESFNEVEKLYVQRFQKKDGTPFWVEIKPIPITQNGEFKIYISNWTDITEHKNMESELKHYSEHLEELVEKKSWEVANSELFLKMTIENVQDYMYIKDKDLKYILVNEALSKFLGKEKEQILNRTAYDFYDKEKADFFTREDKKVFETGSPVDTDDISLVDANGSRHILHSIKSPMKDLENNVTHIIGVARDITDRKRAEEQLERVFNISADMICIADIDGYFRKINPAFKKILGYDSQEILSKPFLDFIHPEDKEKTMNVRREKLSHGLEVINFENRYRCKDGSYKWVSWMSNPIPEEGITFGVGRDITERKSLEKMKEQFISAATHELRTPLVSIKGYTDLLLSPETKLTNDVKLDLKVVRQNADRLISLTDDLLDIRRMEAGKLNLNMQTMDLLEVVERCMKEIKPFIKSKQNIELKIDNKPLLIQADRLRFFQIVMNILVNATKFTPDDGKITLTLREKEDAVEFQVSDTGIGIKKENLQRIFEPFANIEKPTYIEGTGLGLSVTKGLVEEHGGKISVTSPGEGKGATFTILLPKAGAR